jgi:ABC-type polysaccharide/polyol phosphate export permease
MTRVAELADALGAWRIWGAFAADDVLVRYKRSVLGPLWIVLQQGALILGLYLLHRSVFAAGDDDYLLFLAASLPVWALISGMLTEGAMSIVRAKGFLESYPLPPGIYAVRTVAAGFVTFAHLLLVYLAVAVAQGANPGAALLAFVPGLVLIAVFGFGCALAFGALGARFRDIALALPSVMTLLFILTPTFWVPNAEQLQSPLVRLNPFFYLLEVVRQPLLGSWGDPAVWLAAGAISFGTLIVGALVFIRLRPTLVYWL